MPRKSRIPKTQIIKLIEHFIAGTPARSSAVLCGVSRKTATRWYHQFRTIIATHLTTHEMILEGEIDLMRVISAEKEKENEEEELRKRTK